MFISEMNLDKVGRIPPHTKRVVVRKANSHRDLRPLTERATLEKVLGLTVSKNAALACDSSSGIIAYPAGCVVVLFNPRKNKQSFVLSTSKKTITSLAFSGDGKYLATGESGHMPSVRIWDMEDPTHPQIAEMMKGHKFGVACVAFSPNLKYVASVGFQHDMIVNIWNWKAGTKVASNKVSSKVSALSFSENGSYFVTVGVRHVKFWYFDTESNKSKVSKTLVINGRAALLGEQRNNTFCDVACGHGLNSDITYCVTSSGLLCSINSKRVLDTWVELKTSGAHAIVVSEQFIICGCADGIIRVFNPLKLQHIVTLPKPHFLGVNIAEGMDLSNPLSKAEKAAYPDTVAVALDTVNQRLACVYNDHSLYTWDMKDMKKIGKTWSSLYHSTCVWGVEVYPSVPDSNQATLPPGSFLTCSSDDTIRVWNIEDGTSILFERNVYSKEMMKIIYTGETIENLKDTDISPGIKNMRDSTSDSRNTGARCLRVSPDGQTLATGDRSGNVRVYDLTFFDETAKIEAHESEVLCVEFSPRESGHKLLASAGRDRLIHIFNVQNNFSFVQTLDDHSASITSLKFNMSESDELQLLSCGADKSIIFRTAQQNPDLQFVRTTNYVGKTTFYDMDIDISRKHAATACQDRNVRIYDVITGKQTKCYKGTSGDDGTLVKITLDSSGSYAATSCSDKSVCITEFDTGECVASMSGHSEVVTGIKFTADCKNLVSVCGDGCIFVWKIPSTYTQNMIEKLQALGHDPEIKFQFGTPIRRETYKVSHPSIKEETEFSSSESSAFSRPVREPSPPVNYRFSVGQLPSWAKKQLIAGGSDTGLPSESDTNNQQTVHLGGRWAQRIQNGSIHVGGDSGPLHRIAFPLNPADRKRYTIEPISLQEQVRALANSPLERRCSLTKGEDDDLFSFNGKAVLDQLDEDDREDKDSIETPPGVTVSRGSDVMMHSLGRSSLVIPETGELKFEEAEEVEEVNDGEVKEVIIYLPPSQDDFDSEVARSFHLSEAQRPKRLSVTVEDSKGEEQEENDQSKLIDKEKISPSSDDSEDEVTSPSEDVSKPFGEDRDYSKLEGEEDDEVVGRYFETLGTSSPGVKIDDHMSDPPPLDTDRLMRTRLSISARFLSRSNQPGRIGALPPNLDEEASRGSTSDDSKQDFQRRKEEMAQAVEATRKRLEALGWKAKEDILRKLPTSSPTTAAAASSTSTVTSTTNVTCDVSITNTAVVTASSGDLGNSVVATVAESGINPSVITSILETRLSDASDDKGTAREEKAQSVNKEIAAGDKKESAAKEEEESEKSKRSASHLISFFSQSKSSKSKEKENTKEKDKSKSKEKGKSTPPSLEKKMSEAKSVLGSKLERQGSTSSINSQKSEGKSWRKSLGILGGSSKHDKEDKHKKNANLQTDTPVEASTERSTESASPKEEKSSSKSSRTENKEEKSNKKRRSSTPTAELLKKNSQRAPIAQDSDGLKTVIQGNEFPQNSSMKLIQTEGKEERSNKKRRSSSPTVEFLKKNPTTAVHKNGKTDSNTTSSSKNNVQLRDKKGHLTADSRRLKARSLGDISDTLHKVEVSILDPTVPPSRTVDTMDIPDQRTQHIKQPMSTNIVLKYRSEDVHDDDPLKDRIIGNDALKNPISGGDSSPEHDPETSGSREISALDPALEKKSSNQESINFTSASEKKLGRGRESSFLSDISELSAELSAAIASPPPKPIRLSESNLLSSGPPLNNTRALVNDGDEKVVDQDMCQEALGNFVKSFENVMDLYSRLLTNEPSEESNRLLSFFSSTFSTVEEQIHQSRVRRRQWELSSLPCGNSNGDTRPLGLMMSRSTGNLDTISSTAISRRRRHSEISISAIPEVEAELHEVLLDYSKRLMEIVVPKINK